MPVNCKDDELNQIIRTIENLEPDKTSREDNLTKEERKALQELRNDDRIIIKEADKGGALVIMNKQFYENKLVMEDHLNDSTTYTKVDKDIDKNTTKKLGELVKKHEKCLTKKEIDYVKNNDWESSEFYIRPKIHKCKTILDEIKKYPREVIDIDEAQDLVGRPIIAGTNSPTRKISDLISKILCPLVPTQTTYVKDDWDYLRKLPPQLDYKCKLFGCDIKSLYTSIPHHLGLRALEYWISRSRNLIPDRFTNSFIIETVNFLLTNNNCNFNNQMYHQEKGTAMGGPFAPFYACLTVGYLEENILFSQLRNIFTDHDALIIEETYKRFMDDGIIFLPDHICKDEFLKIMNALDENIIFTLEVSEKVTLNNKELEKLNFLDMTIMVDQNGIISRDIYYKSTNTHDYLHYDSFHPKHTLNNITYSLAKKIIIFVSDPEVVEYRLSELKSWLLRCHYPEDVINRGIHNAKLQGPAPQKTKETNIITYIHPNMSNFKFNNIVKMSSNLLQNAKSDEIKKVFTNIKFVEGIKQPKNIMRTITSSHFENNRNANTEKAGIYAECKDPRCVLCNLNYIQECSSFVTANNKKWEIRCHINCNSKNVIYFLKCNMCEGAVSKTGKTFTTLRVRMNNHISNCRTGRTSDVFDTHVHKCGIKNKCLEPPFFEIRAFMKLSTPDKLITYEKKMHQREYATINT